MDVVFGLSGDHSVVTSVFWQASPGEVRGKVFSHGDLNDVSSHHEDLAHIFHDKLGGYHTARAVQVDSPEVAVKYLGKSADLIDMLPPSQLVAKRRPPGEILTPNELAAQVQQGGAQPPEQEQPPAEQPPAEQPPAEPAPAPQAAPQAAPPGNEPVA